MCNCTDAMRQTRIGDTNFPDKLLTQQFATTVKGLIRWPSTADNLPVTHPPP